VPPAPPARTAPIVAAVAVLAIGAVLWGWLRGGAPPLATQVAPVAVVDAVATIPAALPEPAWPRPAWAAARGEDAHVRWADLALAGRTVRLRWCPPGSFMLGSPLDEVGRHADEGPCLATISHGFWLAEVEVAQGLYQAVMGANPSAFRGDDLPVENVTWDEAQGFLRRVNAALALPLVRLPTEAEWEYACRAGAPGAPPAVGWFASNSGNRTHPVGTQPANAWGLHDLRGNVMEWCQDYHAPYPTGAVTDPLGWDGIGRIARGGAWGHAAGEARIALRTRYLAIAHFSFLGFRFAIGG
jgi:formylglycine-generating enzyme required for sulfatase activity